MRKAQAPQAIIKPTTRTVHGTRIRDDYAWLRDPQYPKVKNREILGYLKAENAYTEAVMAPLMGLSRQIFRELKGRVPEEDQGVPAKDGPYLYTWGFAKGTQYRIWKRKPVRGGSWEVFFNENARSRGLDYYRLGGLALSPDHSLLAVTEDRDGSERFTLKIRDLNSGRFLKEEIGGTIGSPVWSADGKVLFYPLVNENWRPYQIKRHHLGDDPKNDEVVFEEKDGSFFAGVAKSHSREFIFIQSGDHVTSEVHVLRADDPLGLPKLVAKRKRGHQYSLDHGNGRFFILTNDRHKNFRVVSAPEDGPEPENWKQLIAPSDANYIRGLEVFRDYLVVQERLNGIDQIRVRFHKGGQHRVKFPERVYSAGIGNTPEFGAKHFRIGYESMITPETVYDYDPVKKKLMTKKVRKIPSGYDKAEYRTERLMAPARDGTEVPVTLLYQKGLKKTGKNPLHLYGYGAYGLGIPPWFSGAALSLVDRGFVYAIAHVRGGDEMGYGWYEAGKLKKRLNAFQDFIDTADFLIAKGFTGKGQISIEGRSAGGELMGYVLNAAPDYWRAALVGVPFVDVLNTMLDGTLPLTPMEWAEWGNPIKNKADFKFIKSYSPYDNIKRQAYPAMFVSGGLNDPRVTYWEPAKWAAKVRRFNTAETKILLKTNMGAGHGGKSGRYRRLQETAEEFAFLLDQFSLAKKN